RTLLCFGSLTEFVVLPPEQQAYQKAEDGRSEDERSGDGNRDPGDDYEADGDNRAGACTGHAQTAELAYENGFACSHVPPHVLAGVPSWQEFVDRCGSYLPAAGGRGQPASSERCLAKLLRAAGAAVHYH